MNIRDPYTQIAAQVNSEGELRVHSVMETEQHVESENGNGFSVGNAQAGAFSLTPPVSGTALFTLHNDSATNLLIIESIDFFSMSTAEPSVQIRIQIDNTVSTMSQHLSAIPTNNNTESTKLSEITCFVWDGTTPMAGVNQDGTNVLCMYAGHAKTSVSNASTRIIGPNRRMSLFAYGDGVTKIAFYIDFYNAEH